MHIRTHLLFYELVFKLSIDRPAGNSVRFNHSWWPILCQFELSADQHQTWRSLESRGSEVDIWSILMFNSFTSDILEVQGTADAGFPDATLQL